MLVFDPGALNCTACTAPEHILKSAFATWQLQCSAAGSICLTLRIRHVNQTACTGPQADLQDSLLQLTSWVNLPDPGGPNRRVICPAHTAASHTFKIHSMHSMQSHRIIPSSQSSVACQPGPAVGLTCQTPGGPTLVSCAQLE